MTLKGKIITVAVLTGLLGMSSAYSQRRPAAEIVVRNDISLTGDLGIDLLQADRHLSIGASFDSLEARYEKLSKSPLQAGLFSAVVPGAGQFYDEDYWQSALFLGLEVALWVAYARYEAKGDRQTSEFQQYADDHWSVVEYVKWIQKYYPNEPSTQGIIVSVSGRPWENVDWDKLNVCEDQIGKTYTGSGFSHRLPRRPDQQYYELIGKYPQFGGGWDDAQYYSPSDLQSRNVSPRFLSYSQMRGDANSFYNIATTASYILVANHIVSALEAAWGAARFNKRVKVEASLTPTNRGYGFVEFVPTAKIQVRF